MNYRRFWNNISLSRKMGNNFLPLKPQLATECRFVIPPCRRSPLLYFNSLLTLRIKGELSWRILSCAGEA